MKYKMKIKITNIDWDIDEDDLTYAKENLPSQTEIEITSETKYLLEDIDGYADNLTEFLSVKYGYCLNHYNVEVEVNL